jgi:hypothetical protein
VQWALYYEPVLPADSFEQLAQIPDANRDARFYVRRAALLLGVGQLEPARLDLTQADRADASLSRSTSPVSVDRLMAARASLFRGSSSRVERAEETSVSIVSGSTPG